MKIFKLNKNEFREGWNEVNKYNGSPKIDFSEVNDRFTAESKIWRYLDFTKFVSLLHYSDLFFTRLDKFYDKYEGDFISDDLNTIFSSYDKDNILTKEIKDKLHHISRMGSFASCWHINEFENYGMWKSYLKTEEGVAIQTNIQSLKASIKQNNKYSLWIDKVIYIDYETEKSMRALFDKHASKGEKITLIPAFFKNKYYEFENELRAVIFYELSLPDVEELNTQWLLETEHSAKPFIKVPIDLKTLIQNIFVHPDAPAWFYDLVHAVMYKYDIDKPILKSRLKKT